MTRKSRPTPSSAVQGPSALALFLLVIFTGVALILLVVGYQLEVDAYLHLLGDVGQRRFLTGTDVNMAQAMALGFGGAKVASVYILADHARKSGVNTLCVWLIRANLVSLSLFAALLVISTNTVSPLADEQIAQARSGIEVSYRTGLEDASQSSDATIARIRDDLRRTQAREHARHTEVTAKYEAGRDAERETGIGPKYADYERLLDVERTLHVSTLNDLRLSAEARIGRAETLFDTTRGMLQEERAKALAGIDFNSIASSAEAQSKSINRAALVLSRIFDGSINVDSITLTIAVVMIISFAVEFAPLLILGSVFATLLGTRPSPALRGLPDAEPNAEPEPGKTPALRTLPFPVGTLTQRATGTDGPGTRRCAGPCSGSRPGSQSGS